MLKSIKVSNFYSVGEEQELSMAINSKDVLDSSATAFKERLSINLVSCIIGANGSGKTTLLKALSFLCWFINDSYTSFKSEREIPVSQHKLFLDKPTKFEVEFINDSLLYTYSIELDMKMVLNECLKKEGVRTPIFRLERSDAHTQIDTHDSLRINSTDEIRFKERQNVPLLSSLIDTGYLTEISFFKKFSTNVTQFGTSREIFNLSTFINITRELQGNSELRQKLLEFSKEIDLGLSGFEFKTARIWSDRNSNKQEEVPILICVHTSKGKEFSLPLIEESNGTQHYVSLFMKIIPMLEQGGLVVFDEIENGIHVEAVKKIISHFENRETNPKCAQLIFSTHQLPLLNDRTKTQIFIAEKNEVLETEIFRLDEIDGIRNDENYFHKYIGGAYGGMPKIQWLRKERNEQAQTN